MRNWVRRGGWALVRERWGWINGAAAGVFRRGWVVDVWRETRGTMGRTWS